ncbi:MAG: hypothetical protein K2G28_11225, partial [Acetatifactor sp.]|nr:hypothetical protein [Acetatifactor sp.]
IMAAEDQLSEKIQFFLNIHFLLRLSCRIFQVYHRFSAVEKILHEFLVFFLLKAERAAFQQLGIGGDGTENVLAERGFQSQTVTLWCLKHHIAAASSDLLQKFHYICIRSYMHEKFLLLL